MKLTEQQLEEYIMNPVCNSCRKEPEWGCSVMTAKCKFIKDKKHIIYDPDREYDELRAEGFRTVGEKLYEEEREEKDRPYSLFKRHQTSNTVEG